MRVMVLAADALDAAGGIAQFNRDLVGALRGNASVTLVARSAGGTSRLSYALAALGAAARERPDVVFCGHLHLAPLGALIARLARAPLWLQLHGIEAWSPPSRLRRAGVAQAALATAVSRHTRARFLEWADVSPERVKVLPNTVDSRFSLGPKPTGLATRLGVAGKRVLLTVGRLSSRERYKGHDRVIAVLPELLRAHPDLCYVIVGDGDDRSRLEALARAGGVEAAVRFAGALAHEQLPDVYRMADVFVMPSTGEGFGIVFLEAVACGVPAIGGAGDGARDPLGDGARGLLVEAESGEALGRAIEQALSTAPARTPHPFGVEAFRAQVARLAASVATG